ncbi:IS1 family transposase [Escherichia coli]|uniref:IS1 family transposase n=1 Tax=Escherichia coli TaxID=562 RepID=UPI0035245FDC
MASVSISCPSCSATDGVVRNGKSTAGHQRSPDCKAVKRSFAVSGGDAANLLI